MNNSTLNEFKIIELIYYEDKNKGKEKIKEIYNDFFETKKTKLKKEFKHLPKEQIKGLLFENIVFFDEMITLLLKTKSGKEVKSKLNFYSYEDFLKYIFDSLIKDLVDYIVN